MLKIIQVDEHTDSNAIITQRFEVFDGSDFRALLVFNPRSRQWDIDSSFTSDEMIEITDFMKHIDDQSRCARIKTIVTTLIQSPKDDIADFISALESDIIDSVYSIDHEDAGALACTVVSELIKDEE